MVAEYSKFLSHLNGPSITIKMSNSKYSNVVLSVVYAEGQAFYCYAREPLVKGKAQYS
jgi:hypothetical protein